MSHYTELHADSSNPTRVVHGRSPAGGAGAPRHPQLRAPREPRGTAAHPQHPPAAPPQLRSPRAASARVWPPGRTGWPPPHRGGARGKCPRCALLRLPASSCNRHRPGGVSSADKARIFTRKDHSVPVERCIGEGQASNRKWHAGCQGERHAHRNSIGLADIVAAGHYELHSCHQDCLPNVLGLTHREQRCRTIRC